MGLRRRCIGDFRKEYVRSINRSCSLTWLKNTEHGFSHVLSKQTLLLSLPNIAVDFPEKHGSQRIVRSLSALNKKAPTPSHTWIAPDESKHLYLLGFQQLHPGRYHRVGSPSLSVLFLPVLWEDSSVGRRIYGADSGSESSLSWSSSSVFLSKLTIPQLLRCPAAPSRKLNRRTLYLLTVEMAWKTAFSHRV
ncbi:hypothetical protein GEV33_001070 [Tenebrio molitor]|uniref:Uncharacterized protein n=1 Tax=Tenebrio molitor TaxID=7067 RepID=A0A8J6LQI7_TENMO|nr:hypothetical protein GEV33_001070 [Tenebrio molitor]